MRGRIVGRRRMENGRRSSMSATPFRWARRRRTGCQLIELANLSDMTSRVFMTHSLREVWKAQFTEKTKERAIRVTLENCKCDQSRCPASGLLILGLSTTRIPKPMLLKVT